MKLTIRTFDVFEEDATGDRYANLNDVLYYLSKTDHCDPEVFDQLKQLFIVEGRQLTGLPDSAPAYHPA
jgi:hypothetical protein